MTDHNEAMRLADLFELEPDPGSLYRQAAALIRKQAERIAEMEKMQDESSDVEASLRDQVATVTAERDTLRAEVERLRVERERWYTSFEHVSRILSGIHALMYPEPFTLSDGRTVVFRPKDPGPHEMLQALSDRIRAIPDEVAAIDTTRKEAL